MTADKKPLAPGQDDALDELSPAQRRRIDRMPPVQRARYLRDHRRAVERRRARRAAMQEREKIVGTRIAPSTLSLRAGVLSAEVTALATSDAAIHASAGNAALAARVAQVVKRSRDLARRAIDLDLQELECGALTASMEQIDATQFQRRVQIRRRMGTVKQNGVAVKARREARTLPVATLRGRINEMQMAADGAHLSQEDHVKLAAFRAELKRRKAKP